MSNEIINHPVLGMCELLLEDSVLKEGDYLFKNGTIIKITTDESIKPGTCRIMNDLTVVGLDDSWSKKYVK